MNNPKWYAIVYSTSPVMLATSQQLRHIPRGVYRTRQEAELALQSAEEWASATNKIDWSFFQLGGGNCHINGYQTREAARNADPSHNIGQAGRVE